MKYYTLHVNDSGAIEDIDIEKNNGESIICKMYDDPEFNKLNDILHSLGEYIINERALLILKESNMIPYNLKKAKVLRKEKIFGFLKMYRSYPYYKLTFLDEQTTECYEWIDFEKSEIFAIDENQKRFKIYSHQEKLDFIKENKSNSNKYCFEAIKIVFGKNFNFEIDLFKIPYYSWGIYISERLKNKLEIAQIRGLGFADGKEKLGKMWKPHFPIIEFDIQN